MATIQSRAGIAASGTPALFAAQIVKNEVIILDAKGSQIGSFKPVIGPLGNLGPLATDMAGNVYVVPLNGYGNTIDIYAPPYSGKPTIVRINAANQIVIGVAVDARTGVFAIMSVGCLPGACGDDRVTFFRHGETKPCNFLFEPRRANGLDTVGSFDRSGTLFVMTSLLYSQRSAIASFSGECAGGQSQLERFPDSPGQFGTEVAFNADDNLVVQARTNGAGPVYTYAHPKGGFFGPPIAVTKLLVRSAYGPIFQALSSDGRHLWASAITPKLGLYNYPAGGASIQHDPVNNAVGVAVFPPLVP